MRSPLPLSVPDDDPKLVELFETLPAAWSLLGDEDDGEALAFAFIRAAYGRGYVYAFETAAPA